MVHVKTIPVVSEGVCPAPFLRNIAKLTDFPHRFDSQFPRCQAAIVTKRIEGSTTPRFLGINIPHWRSGP
jgi:hypothetical protein